MNDVNENKNETIIALKIKFLLMVNFFEYDDMIPNNKAGIVRLPIVYQIWTTEGIKIAIRIVTTDVIKIPNFVYLFL